MSYGAKLLILDEPTAGLDVVARDEILDMLRDYMESGENSIIISSHISSDLEGLCDDVYMIDNGKIVLHEETNVLLETKRRNLLKVMSRQEGDFVPYFFLMVSSACWRRFSRSRAACSCSRAS